MKGRHYVYVANAVQKRKIRFCLKESCCVRYCYVEKKWVIEIDITKTELELFAAKNFMAILNSHSCSQDLSTIILAGVKWTKYFVWRTGKQKNKEDQWRRLVSGEWISGTKLRKMTWDAVGHKTLLIHANIDKQMPSVDENNEVHTR